MSSDLETLQDLNRDYVRAGQAHDTAWYADHLADDFMASTPDGTLLDRAGFLARMSRPDAGSVAQTLEPHIRILGDVALVHAGFRWRKPDGAVGAGRYTDIYARRDDRWLCVSAHFNAH